MSLRSAIWLDGKLTSVLPLPDRGFDFGDGVFETLLVKKGQPLHIDLHLDRLAQGLRALSIPDCVPEAQQQIVIASEAITRDWDWAALRLTVTRGAGARGYTPDEYSVPRIVVQVSHCDRDCGKMSSSAHLIVADIRLSSQPALARIKHLNRLEQVLAAKQVRMEGKDECLVLDQHGYVNSVGAGNLFIVLRGELLTPELSECGVAGTRRRLIIEKWAAVLGIEVVEKRITLSHIQEADEVFYSNSLQTVRPVATLGALAWGKHEICKALFQRHLEELP